MRRWLDGIWVLALMGYICGGLPLVPFHGDESINTAMSIDFHYRYLSGERDKLLYQEDPEYPIEQSYRLNDSPLPRYLMGLAWYVAGYTHNDLNPPWWFAQSYEWNMENGFYPGDDLLLTSRIPSAVLMCIGLAGVFALGRWLGGRATAYGASLYFATQPIILLNGRRAMHEGAHLAFQVLILLAAALWLVRLRGNIARRVPLAGFSVLLGLLGGLGIAGKHTNIMVFGAVGLALMLYTLRHERHQVWRGVWQAALVLAVAGGVFLYFNPALWGSPIARTWEVTQGRAEVLQGQIETFPNSYEGRFTRRLAGAWELALVGQPMYYEDPAWAAAIGGQITTYERSGWAGLLWPGVNAALLPFVVAGLWQLRGRPGPLRWVLGVWAGVLVCFVLVGVPLGWQRYYLPLLPVYGLLAADGLTATARLLRPPR